jgi:type I restriction enzyme, S subunit
MIEVLETERQLIINKSNWDLVKLGDLAEDISKRVDNPAQSGYDRFVGLEHFVSGDLKINNWGSTKNLTSSTKAFQKGDILFARRNAYLRRASLVEFDGVCSGDAFVIREKHDKVVPGFIAFLMNSDALWDYANSNAAGTMSKRVKWRDLAEYEFLLPPKDQQEQIAQLLWAGNELIEKYFQVLQRLESLINLKLDKAFLFPDKYFSDYSITLLKEVCTVQTGLAKGRKVNVEEFVELPYLSVSNVQDGFLDLSVVKTIKVANKEVPRFSVKPGDVLITEGGDFDKVGRGTVWRGEIEDCLHQNHVFCLRPNPVMLFSDFLSFQTGSKYGKRYFLKCAKKTSNLASINSSQVKDFPLITPSLEEQVSLIEDLKTIKNNIEKIKSTIHSSNQLSKGVLQQVFGE